MARGRKYCMNDMQIETSVLIKLHCILFHVLYSFWCIINCDALWMSLCDPVFLCLCSYISYPIWSRFIQPIVTWAIFIAINCDELYVHLSGPDRLCWLVDRYLIIQIAKMHGFIQCCVSIALRLSHLKVAGCATSPRITYILIAADPQKALCEEIPWWKESVNS